jgi:hypothetical protein
VGLPDWGWLGSVLGDRGPARVRGARAVEPWEPLSRRTTYRMRSCCSVCTMSGFSGWTGHQHWSRSRSKRPTRSRGVRNAAPERRGLAAETWRWLISQRSGHPPGWCGANAGGSARTLRVTPRPRPKSARILRGLSGRRAHAPGCGPRSRSVANYRYRILLACGNINWQHLNHRNL